MTTPEVRLERELLLDLYRIAVEEYRFEVHLGWERTSHLLTLDAGLFAASVGLVQLTGDGTAPTEAMIAVVSVIGLGVSWLGVSTVKDSRRYYERTKIKKTFMESRLGLHVPMAGQTSPLANMAITTTNGMSDVEGILADPEAWLRGRPFRWWRRAITSYTGWLFALLALVHAALAVVVLS